MQSHSPPARADPSSRTPSFLCCDRVGSTNRKRSMVAVATYGSAARFWTRWPLSAGVPVPSRRLGVMPSNSSGAQRIAGWLNGMHSASATRCVLGAWPSLAIPQSDKWPGQFGALCAQRTRRALTSYGTSPPTPSSMAASGTMVGEAASSKSFRGWSRLAGGRTSWC